MSADTRPAQRDGRSRRDFFGLTAPPAGALAATLSGCGGGGPEAPPPEVPNGAILTAIMANEGQHLAMLRLAVNRKPVPTAFETAGRNSSSILGDTR